MIAFMRKRLSRIKFYAFMGAMLLLLGVILPAIPTLNVYAATNNSTPIEITNGSKTYTLFNSGRTSSSGYSYTETWGGDYNPNSFSLTNNGYDIHGGTNSSASNRTVIGMGLPFKVSKAITEKASLTIFAFDVDEESTEVDYVYLVDRNNGTKRQVGTLEGRNWTWSTTTIEIDPYYFTTGHVYYFELSIAPGWETWLRNISVNMTTSGQAVVDPNAPSIVTNSFSASISSNGVVNTNLYLRTSKTANYYVEYTASISSTQRGGKTSDVMTVSTSGTRKADSFSLEYGAPYGTYRITAVVKDINGYTVATYSTTCGYNYRSVSYHSNGGSNNLPLDTRAYSSGNTVTVLFDYVPSREGYTFAGWARTANATVAEFTRNGKKTFTMGSSDVALYAVWTQESSHVCQGGEWTVVLKATCGTTGRRQKKCIICGKTMETIILAATGRHTEGDWIIDSYPTCNSDGLKHLECSVCGKSIRTETIYSTGEHYAGDWIIDEQATTTKSGLKHKECLGCGLVIETAIIDALPFIQVENVTTKAGATVKVAVKLTNNPGIKEAVLTVEHDSSLVLDWTQCGSALSTLDFSIPSTSHTTSSFDAVWKGDGIADSNDGTLFYLVFKVPMNAYLQEKFDIKITYNSSRVLDENGEKVDFVIENGTITVDTLSGDANDDGIVDSADIVVIRRYLDGGYGQFINVAQADVNKDGRVSIEDIELLRQRIVGNVK